MEEYFAFLARDGAGSDRGDQFGAAAPLDGWNVQRLAICIKGMMQFWCGIWRVENRSFKK